MGPKGPPSPPQEIEVGGRRPPIPSSQLYILSVSGASLWAVAAPVQSPIPAALTSLSSSSRRGTRTTRSLSCLVHRSRARGRPSSRVTGAEWWGTRSSLRPRVRSHCRWIPWLDRSWAGVRRSRWSSALARRSGGSSLAQGDLQGIVIVSSGENIGDNRTKSQMLFWSEMFKIGLVLLFGRYSI